MTSTQQNYYALQKKPVVALTMGDVAGVGPEVVAAAVVATDVQQLCTPVVVGDPQVLERALKQYEKAPQVRVVSDLEGIAEAQDSDAISCWNPTSAETASVPVGKLNAAAGQAAYDWLVAATQAALANQIDAIVTAPLNKEALHLAGHHYPGHTEILAKECGVEDFAMMLYLPAGEVVRGPYGLGVAHVTLHTSIASVPDLLSTEAIAEKISLIASFLQRVGCQAPRIGVCALNPHAGENGLFGNEEATLIFPAVSHATETGINAMGPFPADTLLQQAVAGRYDGVVAMYHDQGHIALKLIAFQRAVNVTLGLPIVRTSPSHGTAFDIAGKNLVETAGMVSAIRTAVQLVPSKRV
ncbi:4-hydroxythreonine-4-phosphate dehydrogenase PdxA [Thalassoglobus sp.]|uniref:4-hydroxythreonine-4-phosphate dehydrogenase PdxA n=1 Tax=Thalassoglobus sp. TaxID=2795869 RepID=UPI003AA888FC